MSFGMSKFLYIEFRQNFDSNYKIKSEFYKRLLKKKKKLKIISSNNKIRQIKTEIKLYASPIDI